MLFLSSLAICAQDIEMKFRELGFIDISELNPDVRVELMYAGDDNFTGQVLYGGLTRAWLHPDAARAVDKAQKNCRRSCLDIVCLSRMPRVR